MNMVGCSFRSCACRAAGPMCAHHQTLFFVEDGRIDLEVYRVYLEEINRKRKVSHNSRAIMFGSEESVNAGRQSGISTACLSYLREDFPGAQTALAVRAVERKANIVAILASKVCRNEQYRERLATAPSKWGWVIEQAVGLTVNSRIVVPVPADESMTSFCNRLRAMLKGSKKTSLMRFTVRIAAEGGGVTVLKVEGGPVPVSAPDQTAQSLSERVSSSIKAVDTEAKLSFGVGLQHSFHGFKGHGKKVRGVAMRRQRNMAGFVGKHLDCNRPKWDRQVAGISDWDADKRVKEILDSLAVAVSGSISGPGGQKGGQSQDGDIGKPSEK